MYPALLHLLGDILPFFAFFMFYLFCVVLCFCVFNFFVFLCILLFGWIFDIFCDFYRFVLCCYASLVFGSHKKNVGSHFFGHTIFFCHIKKCFLCFYTLCFLGHTKKKFGHIFLVTQFFLHEKNVVTFFCHSNITFPLS